MLWNDVQSFAQNIFLFLLREEDKVVKLVLLLLNRFISFLK